MVSAPPIGRIAVGRDKQRHVIMYRFGQPEAKRYRVEEGGLRQGHALSPQVIAGGKDQFVLAGGERIARQQRRVAPALARAENGRESGREGDRLAVEM
jgi:hypothetical protein